MYIQRNNQGEIVRASRVALPGCDEPIARNAPELLAFFGLDAIDSLGQPLDEFRQSDLDFVRVLDDLIYLLMDKGIFSFTELPEAAQRKLMKRQSLRRRDDSVDLLSDTDDEFI